MRRVGAALICLSLAAVSTLRAELSNVEAELGVNGSALGELLKQQVNPYLEELQGHWSFNQTSDISKYEEFDHTRFQGSRELSMDELVELARRLKIRRQQGQRKVPGLKARPTRQSVTEPTPHFLSTSLAVTAHLGGIAYLRCLVSNVSKDKPVAWVRQRDWHILTVGRTSYTNDERFHVLHAESSSEWTLQIRYLQERDGGEYECQVPHNGGTLKQSFRLKVVVPKTEIPGPREYHIGRGSLLSLLCIVSNSPWPPQTVLWYHNDELLSYDEGAAERWAGEEGWPRATVTSEDSEVNSTNGDSITTLRSRLVIREATAAHSGNYSCRASGTKPDSVYVFVSTDGDNIAAIQRHNSSCRVTCQQILFFILSFMSTIIR